MRRLVTGSLLALSIAACDSTPADRSPEPTSRPRVQAVTGQATVVLLATAPGASESHLLHVPVGAGSPPSVVARLPHPPDGEARGVLLPDKLRVAVVADGERRRDPSFGAWLSILTPGLDPRPLVGGCAHASRPWLLPSGRLLVQRGEPGPELDPASATSGELRTDALRVDEIDPDSGERRSVHEFSGYITHIAGVLDDEVFLYRVAHQFADLIAVKITSGSQRVLARPIAAQARDFSLEPATRSLVYANLGEGGWVVERLALDSGERELVASAGGMWVTPSVWPGGGVLLNDGRGAITLGGNGPSRPLGPGFDEVSAVSADGQHVVLTHRVPSGFASVFVTDSQGGKVTLVQTPAARRASVVGVLP